MKFWLLTLTHNWVLRLVILKMNLRKKRNNNNNNYKNSSGSGSNNDNNSNNNKPQQKMDHRLQQVADYQPGDHLKEGTYIHPFVGPVKGVKKSDDPHINKDGSPLSVLMLFNAEIFHLLVEQMNIYYQQHLDGQAGPSH